MQNHGIYGIYLVCIIIFLVGINYIKNRINLFTAINIVGKVCKISTYDLIIKYIVPIYMVLHIIQNVCIMFICCKPVKSVHFRNYKMCNIKKIMAYAVIFG